MVQDQSEGAGRLPNEAFASSGRPDPSRDEHVAFPEGPGPHPSATGSLPESAWAPPPAAPRSIEPYESHASHESHEVYVESLRPGVTLYRRGRPWRFIPFDPKNGRGRRGRARPWIVALVLGAVLYSGATQTTVQFSGDAVQVEADAPGLFGSPVEIREVVADDLASVQPMDQQLHELPSRPSSVRIEVVATDDTNASVNVATGSGDGNVIDIPLPYAADVRFDGELARLWVTVSPNVEHATVQCRVYADGALVAINTDVGLVECVVEPVPSG